MYPTNNNLSFTGRVIMPKKSSLAKKYGSDIAEIISSAQPQLKNLAEKNNLIVRISNYSNLYNEVGLLGALVQKEPTNRQDILKNILERINIFSDQNRKTFIPNSKNFSKNTLINEITKLAEKLKK